MNRNKIIPKFSKKFKTKKNADLEFNRDNRKIKKEKLRKERKIKNSIEDKELFSSDKDKKYNDND